MRSSNKSRSRNKNNNRRSSGGGNVVNRVFDSSGPEGKVRGTPQQIIEKYQGLAQDAQRSGDRVAAENFLQHCEHYSRMLGEAMREQAARREQIEAQQAQHSQNNNQRRDNQRNDGPSNAHNEAQPNVAAVPTADPVAEGPAPDSGLVETPESRTKRPRRAPAKKPPQNDADKDMPVKADDQPNSPDTGTPESSAAE